MNSLEITVREATREDAVTIAQVVAMAIGDQQVLCDYCGEDYLSVLTEVASKEVSQYSWRYAYVADLNGVVAGAIVGYDGAKLAQLREGTLEVLRKRVIGRVPTMADETEAGEYYLDSIGVLPEFRGLGVGRELIAAFCKNVFAKGYERVGLIVDCDNARAEKLYISLGFKCVGTRLFFGHDMWHLQRTSSDD
ncbi:MAG: GNAT family N-acetyltransferase [Alistipes sp.]|nr:GNAT family N-acetyltransferase [Alistipes sp.]